MKGALELIENQSVLVLDTLDKITALAQQISGPSALSKIKDLTQDERYILANYLGIMSSAKSNSQQYQQQLLQLLQQSIGG